MEWWTPRGSKVAQKNVTLQTMGHGVLILVDHNTLVSFLAMITHQLTLIDFWVTTVVVCDF